MRRTAFSLALAVLSAFPALADGEPAGRERSGLTLPPHQSNVIVSIERGVRVWRPVTPAYLAVNNPDAYAPDYEAVTPSYSSYGTNGYDGGQGYGYGNGYGWGLPYGYGFGRKRERLNGVNPLISQHPALSHFNPGAPRALPDRIRIIGHGFPRGPFHPPVTIHVNLGPGPHIGPRGFYGHGGGPGRQALLAPRGGAHHSGGHRGGHR